MCGWARIHIYISPFVVVGYDLFALVYVCSDFGLIFFGGVNRFDAKLVIIYEVLDFLVVIMEI